MAKKSECPSFGVAYDPNADECKYCAEEFPEDYEACGLASGIVKSSEPEFEETVFIEPLEEASQEEPEVVEPVPQERTSKRKLRPSRDGTVLGVMADCLMTAERWTRQTLAEAMAKRRPTHVASECGRNVKLLVPFLIRLGLLDVDEDNSFVYVGKITEEEAKEQDAPYNLDGGEVVDE